MEFRSGNHERARELLSEFIRIRRDNNTTKDGDYVNVLFMVGNIHKIQKNQNDAGLCWTEAYKVFQELGLEDQNPEIAAMMNELLQSEVSNDEGTEKKSRQSFFGKLKGMPKDVTKGKGIQL